MKKTKNTLKAAALMVLFTAFLNGAHAYSNGKSGMNSIPENSVNTPVNYSASVPFKAAAKKIPVEVKNVWHNMPSFDKYGNEITPRARFNMMQHTINNK